MCIDVFMLPRINKEDNDIIGSRLYKPCTGAITILRLVMFVSVYNSIVCKSNMLINRIIDLKKTF